MNTATCPHCNNAYSQTAKTCHHCERTIQSNTFSEFGAVEPNNHSKPATALVHALAVFSGIAGFVVAYNLHNLLHLILMPFNIFIGYYGRELTLGLFLLVIFLLLGAFFGFKWDKGGWKLGFSLGGLVAALFILAFLLDVFSGNFSFNLVVGAITHIFPVLVGGFLGLYFGAKYKQNQQKKTASTDISERQINHPMPCSAD